MEFIYLKLKKIKQCLKHLYSLENIVEEKLLKIDYEKIITEKNLKKILNYDIEKKESQIIVSLTTYNKRIHDVHLVIESIFRQTKIPNKIILWLAENEFSKDDIPYILKKLEKKGLEIKFCKDLKSYKKLIPALKEYPNDIIITIDDDILYNYDLVENLYREYLKNKDRVICSRAHKYKFKNKKLENYRKWDMECINELDNLFLTSGGGTLFPPDMFDKDFFDIEKIFELCPFADDIWINAMLLKNNKKIKLINNKKKWSEKVIILKSSQNIGLFKKNIDENQNDIQLKKVFDYYKLWEKL